MLVILTDIPSEREADFNRWYDREHTAERVAIPGFLGARRFLAAAEGGLPKYLALYETAVFEVLTGQAYRSALAQQTEWSKAVMAHFENVKRSVARIALAQGRGRGGAAVVVRLRPQDGAEALRAWLGQRLSLALEEDDLVSGFLLESDPEQSKPLAEHRGAAKSSAQPAEDPSARDWMLVLEATSPEVAAKVVDRYLAEPEITAAGGLPLGRRAYRLLWSLERDDLLTAGQTR